MSQRRVQKPIRYRNQLLPGILESASPSSKYPDYRVKNPKSRVIRSAWLSNESGEAQAPRMSRTPGHRVPYPWDPNNISALGRNAPRRNEISRNAPKRKYYNRNEYSPISKNTYSPNARKTLTGFSERNSKAPRKEFESGMTFHSKMRGPPAPTTSATKSILQNNAKNVNQILTLNKILTQRFASGTDYNKNLKSKRIISVFLEEYVDAKASIVKASNSVTKLTVKQFAKLVANMFLDTAHDFQFSFMTSFTWVNNYIHAFERYITEPLLNETNLSSANKMRIHRVQSIFSKLLGERGGDNLVIKSLKEDFGMTDLLDPFDHSKRSDFKFRSQKQSWERTCYKHVAGDAQRYGMTRKAFILPSMPRGNPDVPLALDMSALGSGKSAYTNYIKTITLPGMADAGAVFLSENKFFEIVGKIIDKNIDRNISDLSGSLFSDNTDIINNYRTKSKKTQKIFKIDLSDFHYDIQVVDNGNATSVMDVKFVVNTGKGEPYVLFVNDNLMENGISSNPTAIKKIGAIFPELKFNKKARNGNIVPNNTVRLKPKKGYTMDRRNIDHSGKVFGAVLSKFLGDFSQVMHSLKTGTTFSTGDYMCGVSYLTMSMFRTETDKYNKQVKPGVYLFNPQIFIENSQDLSYNLFYRRETLPKEVMNSFRRTHY